MGRWYLRSLEEAAEPSLFVAWQSGGEVTAGVIEGKELVLYVNPELQRLRMLVEAARARLAELEAGFTIEKAKLEAMKARLFARLREHFQWRDRLRLVIGYRRKYLESLVRQGEEEAGKIAQEYRQASAQSDREYAETAAALAEKQELSAGEAAEVSQLWRKLVKLFHPDRCAHEPEKQETYHKLTAAINHAKDHGDLATLRRIADDPQGFIPRQSWAALDRGLPLQRRAGQRGRPSTFPSRRWSDEPRRIAQLRRLWEGIKLEIIRVLEASNALKESPDYELHRLTTQTPRADFRGNGVNDAVTHRHQVHGLDAPFRRERTEGGLRAAAHRGFGGELAEAGQFERDRGRGNQSRTRDALANNGQGVHHIGDFIRGIERDVGINGDQHFPSGRRS